jgi:hypothetical protein
MLVLGTWVCTMSYCRKWGYDVEVEVRKSVGEGTFLQAVL